MARDHQKRSSLHVVTRPGADPAGVGGRHGSAGPAGRGGGYQGSCTEFNVDGVKKNCADPRIDELRTMGLPLVWIKIAETIGFESFLSMWRTLDDEPALRTDKGDLAVTLRSFRSYLRFQRNRYIEEMWRTGTGITEIQAKIYSELCEKISRRHISRLVSGR